MASGGTFVAAILIARSLGKEGFGQFSAIQTSAAALAGVAAAGVGVTATRFVARARSEGFSYLAQTFRALSILLLSTTLLLAALWTFLCRSHLLVAGPSGMRAWAVGLILLALTSFTSFSAGILTGFEDFPSLAASSTVQSALTIMMILACSRTMTVTSALLVSCASLATLALFHAFRIWRSSETLRCCSTIHSVPPTLSVVTRFCVPASLSGIVGNLAIGTAAIVLVRMAGSASELATFSAASALRSAILLIPTIGYRILLPRLCADALVSPNLPLGTFWRGVFVSTSLAVLGASFAVYAGPTLMGLYGKEFRAEGAILRISALSAVLEALAGALYQILVALSKQWVHLAVVSVWALTLLSITAGFAAQYGALALSSAYCAAWLLSCVLYAVAAVVLARNCSVGGSIDKQPDR